VILPHVLGRLLDQLLVLSYLIAPRVFQHFIQLFGLFNLFEPFLVFDELLFPGLLSLRDVVSYPFPVNFSLLTLFLLHIFFSLNFMLSVFLHFFVVLQFLEPELFDEFLLDFEE
jgi:hypothetical protein